MDLIYIAGIFVQFILTAGLARGCSNLRSDKK